MRTQIFTLLLIFSLVLPGFSQQEKISPALQQFLQTNFMRQYQDIRTKAEAQIRAFASQAGQYAPQDVARVQVAYDQTANRFNQLLEMVKQDFLDQQKLKYITRFPDSYSRGLELEIRKLSDFYAQHFQQNLADVTGNQMDGSPLIILLFDLVKFTGTAVHHFVNIRREARRYNEQYLNQHLIGPNRFRKWNQVIGGGFSDPYSNPHTPPTNDPWSNPTNDPWSNPNNPPTNDPWSNPTNDPWSDPNNPPTNDPWSNPTNDPWSNPNNPPTNDPWSNPTNDPWSNPNNPPTNDPWSNPNSNLYAPTNPSSNNPNQDTYNQTSPTTPTAQNPGSTFSKSQPGSLKKYYPRTITPKTQSDAIWINQAAPQHQESTYGQTLPPADSTKTVTRKKGNQNPL